MFVMNSIAENPKAAMKEEDQTDDLPSKNVGSNAVPDPVGTLVWTQAPTDFTLPGVVQCAQHHDPHTFRLHYLFTYSITLVEPLYYLHLLYSFKTDLSVSPVRVSSNTQTTFGIPRLSSLSFSLGKALFIVI